MAKVLKRAFYERDTVVVARELLGQTLCRRVDSGKILRGRITETEAYDGFEDRASHAHRGVTVRNKVMFGPAGCSYVYLCYGVHWLLNLTTREAGYPAAVLIRGVAGASGPGRLSQHFQVDKRFNEVPLTRVAGLWVEASNDAPDRSEILATPRIGVDYAGAEWAAMPWRFVVK
jgi:DNA-3-methyladenine glycosylase